MNCLSPEFFFLIACLQLIMALHLLLLLVFFSFAASNDTLPRPLIIETTEKTASLQRQTSGSDECELNQPTKMKETPGGNDNEENHLSLSSENTRFDGDEEQRRAGFMSWRLAVEANNLNPWDTVPMEFAEYVKEYVTGEGYKMDLERVSSEAGVFARSVKLGGDGKDVWIFDIDETLLSNMPYYDDHGYGLEEFDWVGFNEWVDRAKAPAIAPSLELYKELLGLGFKVFLLTGRSEKQRSATEENLINAGFKTWDKLILRSSDDHGKTATTYKSEKRCEMVKEGYRILGNSGDQWSDLLGPHMSIRSFKLPNPMYYIR